MHQQPLTVAAALAACCCFVLLSSTGAAAAYHSHSATTFSGSVRKKDKAEASEAQDPISRIVSLITQLKAKVEEEGTSEQQSYDKYACWCEETLAQKASDISAGKENIESLQTLIVKLKGEIATHGASIVQLKKDIEGNIASQKEATDVRSKEEDTYQAEKTESEQCIGALEAAIRVLSGAGGSKKGFLETMQEAQLLSVAASIRGLLGRPTARRAAASHGVSESDLSVVAHFAERPEDFVSAHPEGRFLSATQIANNPFGDYAPQSTQIQGILKNMYDSFSTDLERSNAEESVKQKSFEELMATKKAELKTLQETLELHTYDEAQKTKKVAESKSQLDDAKFQLKSDETFFAESKAGCKAKAAAWAQRTRLRTEELQSFSKAIEILSSDSATKTFQNATTTMLLQLSSKRGAEDRAQRSYEKISALAARYGSLGLAKIAVLLKSEGHFDKVIAAIDRMHEVLRAEEQEDIAHRDRCQGSVTQNTNHREDLNYSIAKTEGEIKRMEDEHSEMETKMTAIADDINNTQLDIAELKEMRAKEYSNFLQATKADTEAIGLLNEAITTLSEYYRSNGIPLSLRQSAAGEPEYSDAAPETTWTSGNYGGKQGESGGIIAILSMIKEDLEKEIQVGGVDDATAQKNYEHDLKAMGDVLASQKASKAALAKEMAGLQAQLVDSEEFKTMKGHDLSAAQEKATALGRDCAWVASHFESRRTKRKAEMDGLVEAKSYLAGVEAGDEV
jgi:hypothetical protein